MFRITHTIPFLLLLIITSTVASLTSCQKQRRYYTEVQEIKNVTEDYAEVLVYFNLLKKGNYKIGICWSIDTVPVKKAHHFLETTAEKSRERLFYIEGLQPNNTYRLKPYIIFQDGDLLYTETETLLETVKFPTLECTVQANQVTGNQTTINFDNLTRDTLGGLVNYTSENTESMIKFSFKTEPNSGYYTTRGTQFNFNDDTPYQVLGLYTDGVCAYYFNFYQTIRVLKHPNGKLTISFCNVQVKIKNGFGCWGSYGISGQVSN